MTDISDVSDCRFASDNWENSLDISDDEDDIVLKNNKSENKNLKADCHPFLQYHPLYLSHSVRCNFQKFDEVIPNFIGGALPRSDKGDREYYCCVMMTLFKSWREPSDLKSLSETWDATFVSHTFTDRQLQLLANFDVRYECNDARDDHYNNLKKKTASMSKNFANHFAQVYRGESVEYLHEDSGSNFGIDEPNNTDVSLDFIGRRSLKIAADQRIARKLIYSCGWLKKCIDQIPSVDTNTLVHVYKSRQTWNNIVKE
ncbi:hypothetical protein B0H10DRAFT_1774518, partial [Mycena sp. CBHHK59/15]